MHTVLAPHGPRGHKAGCCLLPSFVFLIFSLLCRPCPRVSAKQPTRWARLRAPTAPALPAATTAPATHHPAGASTAVSTICLHPENQGRPSAPCPSGPQPTLLPWEYPRSLYHRPQAAVSSLLVSGLQLVAGCVALGALGRVRVKLFTHSYSAARLASAWAFSPSWGDPSSGIWGMQLV